MKRGFSIIEVILGIALFSIIGTMLFQTMMQITKTLRVLNEVSSLDMRSAVISNLLEKDLAGAFVPEIIPIKDEKDEAKKTTVQPKKGNIKKEDTAQNKDKQKKQYPPQGFYAKVGSDGALHMLTFISTNPIAVYDAGKSVPVRIMYTLEPFQPVPGTFVLKRQEGSDYMNIKLFTDVKSSEVRKVEVASAVRSIHCTFWALEKKEEEKKTTEETVSKPSKDKTITVKKETTEKKSQQKWVKLEQWNSDEQEEDKPRTLPLVPEFVQIKMILATGPQQSGDHVVELLLPTTGGMGKIVIEGIKPLQSDAKDATKKTAGGKFDDLFDEKKLSSGLNEKLKQLDAIGKKPSPSSGKGFK